MIRRTQKEQDRLWRHYQLKQPEVFEMSYSRIRFFAQKCRPGEVVLNVGIGSGLLERILLERGVSAYTLDPSPEALRRAQNMLGKRFIGKCGYLEKIPFPSSYFDQVICTEVFEHLTAGQLHAGLKEIRRILKPSGVLSGSVPYQEKLGDGLVICPRCLNQFHRWGHHLGGWSKTKMRHILEKAGFDVKGCHPRAFSDFHRPGFKNLLRATFRLFLGRMGEAIVGPSLVFHASPKPARRESGKRR